MCLSRQNTSFVATKVCLQRQNFYRYKIMFVTTKYFCRDKTFVATNILSQQTFCRDKSMLAATKLLSLQNYVSRDKIFLSRQNLCRNKYFVATEDLFCREKHVFVAKIKLITTTILLSQQKTCFVAKNNCLSRQKCHITFVAAKIILVADPANDKQERYRLH